jgi:hypothetical protein
VNVPPVSMPIRICPMGRVNWRAPPNSSAMFAETDPGGFGKP